MRVCLCVLDPGTRQQVENSRAKGRYRRSVVKQAGSLALPLSPVYQPTNR